MHLTLNPYDRSRPFARTKRKKSSEISPLPPPLKILLLIRMERQSCLSNQRVVLPFQRKQHRGSMYTYRSTLQLSSMYIVQPMDEDLMDGAVSVIYKHKAQSKDTCHHT